MSHTGNTALIELTGEVRGTDLDSPRFSLRLADGRTNYEPKHEQVVLEALGDHSNRRLRIIGVGQFAAGNEKIGANPQRKANRTDWFSAAIP
jgi:hypothetical protein